MKSREDFFAKLVVLAEMCGKALSKEILVMYDETLRSLGYPQLCKAVEEIILNRGDRDAFPSIKTIREKVRPPQNQEVDAIDAANRISEAMAKYGYGRRDEAKEFIGELGWLIVERQGGWENLCENTLASQMPILKAQWRELGKALWQKAKDGTLHEAPALPESTNPEKVLKLGSTIKSLGTGNE